MPGGPFPYIPLNKRGDPILKKSQQVSPKRVDKLTNRGPCDMVRRYHNGMVDTAHTAMMVVELVERAKDLNQGGPSFIPFNEAEKALLTLFAPGAKFGIPPKVAQTMLRVKPKEAKVIAKRVAQALIERRSWNAGFGGGMSAGNIDKSVPEEDDKSLNAPKSKREDPDLVFKDLAQKAGGWGITNTMRRLPSDTANYQQHTRDNTIRQFGGTTEKDRAIAARGGRAHIKEKDRHNPAPAVTEPKTDIVNRQRRQRAQARDTARDRAAVAAQGSAGQASSVASGIASGSAREAGRAAARGTHARAGGTAAVQQFLPPSGGSRKASSMKKAAESLSSTPPAAANKSVEHLDLLENLLKSTSGWKEDEHGGAGLTTEHGRYEVGKDFGGHYALYAPHGSSETTTVGSRRKTLQDAKDIVAQHHFEQQNRVSALPPGDARGARGSELTAKPRQYAGDSYSRNPKPPRTFGSGNRRAYGSMKSVAHLNFLESVLKGDKRLQPQKPEELDEREETE